MILTQVCKSGSGLGVGVSSIRKIGLILKKGKE